MRVECFCTQHEQVRADCTQPQTRTQTHTLTLSPLSLLISDVQKHPIMEQAEQMQIQHYLGTEVRRCSSLSVSLSLSRSICLSVSLSVCLSVSLSRSVCISPFLCGLKHSSSHLRSHPHLSPLFCLCSGSLANRKSHRAKHILGTVMMAMIKRKQQNFIHLLVMINRTCNTRPSSWRPGA